MQSIEHSCYWLATRADSAKTTELQENCDADIVVVGAGFTGLWTAYFLKQLDPSKHVIVIEQGVAGYGGSGRNAGMISSCLDHSHELAIEHFGKAEAARLAKVGKANFDELAAYAVDCDFERSGQLLVALNKKQIVDLEDNHRVATELGIEGYRLLNADEVRSELNSPLYQGAVFVPNAGIINPVKLVDKIKNEIVEKGAQLFENTRVMDIKGSVVQCQNGAATGKKIILATDSYSHYLFPQLLRHYIPLYDYIQVSEPLNQDQLDSIGWKNRQGVIDCRNFFNYYRLTADNRFLWGTSDAIYYPPNRVDSSFDHSESHKKLLQESFDRHFPQLRNLQFPYEWGGPIASTTRLTPFFGTLEGGQVIYALGYTGHGIGSTRLAGKIIAHMALARETDLTSLSMVRKKPFPFPPEPIRSISVNAVSQSLRKVDQGENPNLLLKLLDLFGIAFSS
jgi:glycine/D-amino acid oxidase-like deaminating enzyme